MLPLIVIAGLGIWLAVVVTTIAICVQAGRADEELLVGSAPTAEPQPRSRRSAVPASGRFLRSAH